MTTIEKAALDFHRRFPRASEIDARRFADKEEFLGTSETAIFLRTWRKFKDSDAQVRQAKFESDRDRIFAEEKGY
jgi:hypothetical protein